MRLRVAGRCASFAAMKPYPITASTLWKEEEGIEMGRGTSSVGTFLQKDRKST